MEAAGGVSSAVDLIGAIKSLDEQRVCSLIESSCELDFFLTDSDGMSYTPLLKAVAIGAIHIVVILLEGGAKVNRRDQYGRTALHSACVNGYVDIAALCVKYGADVDTQDHGGGCPLLAAAAAGQTDAMNFLIQNGAKVNLENFRGETALSIATQKMHLECVESLLSAGASVNIKGSEFQPLCFCAQRSENKETAIKMAKVLIEAGAEVNYQGSITGRTALHWAVMVSNITMVRLLLDSGADPDRMDYSCNARTALTCLTFVEESQDALEIAEILVGAGAKVNYVDKRGMNALFAAIFQNDRALADYLIQQGIHLDTGIWSALDCAVDSNRMEIVVQLLQAGAEVDGAVHTAVIHGRNSMVHMFLEHSTFPTLKNTTDPREFMFKGSSSLFPVRALSPLSTALFSGNIEMAHHFLSISFLTDYDIYGLALENYTSTFLSLYFSHLFSECQALLQILVSQPWRLEAMAFVAVSTQLGGEKGRKGRVDKLPLPESMKRRLRFEVGGYGGGSGPGFFS